MTYLDTRINTFSNYNFAGQTQNFTGEQFPYASKWQYVLDGEYTVPVQSNIAAYLGGSERYQSATNAQFGNYPVSSSIPTTSWTSGPESRRKTVAGELACSCVTLETSIIRPAASVRRTRWSITPACRGRSATSSR